MKMNPLVIIPARGGSKGIPKKNIKQLDGKPLIFYTIDAAKYIFPEDLIIVSTDDHTIKKMVEGYGLKIPFLRPSALAEDNTPTYDVLIHTVMKIEESGYFPDTIILLQATSPFRNGQHIQQALDIFTSDFSIDMVVSVKNTNSNPYYNLKEEDDNGWLKTSKSGNFIRRQDCPPVFELNGAIYIIKTSVLKRKKLNQITRVKKYVMNDMNSIDIDDQLDWDFAEYLLKSKKVTL